MTDDKLELRAGVLQRVFVGGFCMFLLVGLAVYAQEFWNVRNWVFRVALVGSILLAIRGIGYALFRKVEYSDRTLTYRNDFGRTMRIPGSEIESFLLDNDVNLRLSLKGGLRLQIHYHEGDTRAFRAVLQNEWPDKELHVRMTKR
jgi:hypothetical protein